MSILGIESVTYANDDLETAERFWTDFGLTLLEKSEEGLLFECLEGATMVVRKTDDPDLPQSPGPDPTAREVVFSVSDKNSLDQIAETLQTHGYEASLSGETLRTVDPNGYTLGFRVTQKRPLERKTTLYNNPTNHQRVDERADIFMRATPLHLSHVAILCPNLEQTYEFYEAMGFVLTDIYDHGRFFRRPGAPDHHNVFVLNVEDVYGFHHVAFDVQDLHQVFGGGSYLDKLGWETHIGPGRHPISSAYFWYFVNPCGGAAEYDFDADLATDAWEPRHFPPTPESFAEWAIPKGLEKVSYRGAQTTSQDEH